MKEKLYTHLKERTEGASSAELAQEVLGIKGATGPIADKIVCAAIGDDGRFEHREDGLWKASEAGGLPLDEAEFAIVHLTFADTTVAREVPVEIAMRRFKDGKIVAKAERLLNPGAPLLPESASLTGIPVAALSRSRSLTDSFHQVQRFVEDLPIVAFGARRVVRQLSATASSLGTELENRVLCVRLLLRALSESEPPASLEALAARFGVTFRETRRAGHDLDIVEEAFRAVLDLLPPQGITTVEEAEEFQYPQIEEVDFSRYSFDRDFLGSLPECPGVYLMENEAGEIIYVGKSKNLRGRVSSYFRATGNRDEKAQRIIDEVHSIECQETDTEPEALMLEAELIIEHRPDLNRQVEIHERAAHGIKGKRLVIVLPSASEGQAEVFLLKPGFSPARLTVGLDATAHRELKKRLKAFYFGNRKRPSEDADAVRGMEVISSWLASRRHAVNYVDLDATSGLDDAARIVGDHVRDAAEGAGKVWRV